MDPFLAVPLGPALSLNPEALKEHGQGMLRLAADRDRTVVFAGARASLLVHREDPESAFERWLAFVQEHSGWSYGMLSYDLKNGVERLRSRNADRMGFPGLWWAVPRFVVVLERGQATLHTPPDDRATGLAWSAELLRPAHGASLPIGPWRTLTEKEVYMERIARILGHIRRGDVYELNYCIERIAEAPDWNPYAAFAQLYAKLSPPFGAFFKLEDRFAVCASPERFLRTEDRRIVAEPMKGTRPRDLDPQRDGALAEELEQDRKERSENIMAVDVMRNDLSRVAASGSVVVDELCKVRSYPAVHQLVSMVSATLREGIHPVEAVKAAYPMASMTGAPKIKAMELIDAVEDLRRGLFSGALGHFDGAGDLDLNVVIRTIQYHATTGTASLISGGAITALSDPAQEWEECQLKAMSVLNALQP